MKIIELLSRNSNVADNELSLRVKNIPLVRRNKVISFRCRCRGNRELGKRGEGGEVKVKMCRNHVKQCYQPAGCEVISSPPLVCK